MKYLLTALMVVLTFASVTTAQDDIPMVEATKEHKMLTDNVGQWNAEITFWMEGPDGPTNKATGVETVEAVGPFWITSDLEYEFMGMMVKGHGVMGYDMSKKKFIGTWYDSMNPSESTMVGTYDAEKNVVVYMGASKSPTGEEVKFKILDYIAKDGKKDFEMYMGVPGTDEFAKFMHIAYTKKTDE